MICRASPGAARAAYGLPSPESPIARIASQSSRLVLIGQPDMMVIVHLDSLSDKILLRQQLPILAHFCWPHFAFGEDFEGSG